MRFNELEVGQKFRIAGDKKGIYLKGLLHSTGKPKVISLKDGHIYDINNQNVIPIDDNNHKQERMKIVISDYAEYYGDFYLSVTEEQMRLLEYLDNIGFITLKEPSGDYVEV